MGYKKNCDMRCLHRDDPTAQNCEGCAGKKEQAKQERSVTEWDGEGLPPVGVVVELVLLGNRITTGHLIANYNGYVWIKCDDAPKPEVIEHKKIVFRSIRTERERMIEKITSCMCKTGSTSWDVLAEALYESNLFDISLREDE